MNQSDPTIDRIRQVRHEISERFGHDPDKLVRHYMELDKQFSDRLLESDEGELQENLRSHVNAA